ncbi:NAD-dependent DNA ligase LigA [Candidatus Vampirococcus lugosii]|uniref:DNA ligase n=1 Tax=Candidatus Vampirococcus lugosii TaxID=2789015 RepID=A0ABS5QLB0_9BACT|nr:NAD-dependent DNA ligase LigA [Candidatus Vampirococcus lugosii]
MINNDIEELTQKFLNCDYIENTFDYYQNLIEVLIYHNNLYYIYNTPSISDYQYDLLFDLLKKIEKENQDIISPNSPTQRLVGQIQNSYKTYNHDFPMLSLENAYDTKDLFEKDKFIKKRLNTEFNYSLEPKFDGSSVELIYKNGVFEKAITRGDGFVGEDITENIKVIETVPLYLKNAKNISYIILRGEIVMPKSSFNKLNKKREKEGKSLFANPRNAATGTLRQLDPQVVADRKLVCFIYELTYISSEIIFDKIKTQKDIFIFLKNLGFTVYDWLKITDNIQDLVNICQDIKTKNYFENQNIEFDGIVIKVNQINFRKKLGETNHHPRWAIAYKFPAKQIVTKILDVELNVSRSASINPVAILQTVNLSGVNISRVSLHNWDFISQKDIKIGDNVWIQRSGEVIPYIVGVIKEKRDGNEKEILAPNLCPICDSKIIKVDTDVNYYCSNINCPSVIKEKIVHFVSKNCLDIDGIGEKLIYMLVDNGFIKHYADLYYLKDKINYLKSLPLLGEKRINDILEKIENSKKTFLRRFINGLGIKFVGKKTSKILENSIYEDLKYNNIDISKFNHQKLIKYLTDQTFLSNIHGIGDKIIFSLKQTFENQENLQILYELEKVGVVLNNFYNQKSILDSKLSGIKFCITGSFDIKRDEIIKILENNGAEFLSQVSSKLDFLIVGKGGGSKLQKAKKEGIKTISLDDLYTKYNL